MSTEERKAARTEATRRWRNKNREKWNAYCRSYRSRKYGLSEKAYFVLLARQEGKCGACNTPFSETPHIDHDHETGQVRGLLCRGCNTGIGSFKENIHALQGAIEYLRKHGSIA